MAQRIWAALCWKSQLSINFGAWPHVSQLLSVVIIWFQMRCLCLWGQLARVPVMFALAHSMWNPRAYGRLLGPRGYNMNGEQIMFAVIQTAWDQLVFKERHMWSACFLTTLDYHSVWPVVPGEYLAQQQTVPFFTLSDSSLLIRIKVFQSYLFSK